MATQPEIAPPDTIEPQSPQEAPATPTPTEQPFQQPDEIVPQQPDIIDPEPGMPEIVPPLD